MDLSIPTQPEYFLRPSHSAICGVIHASAGITNHPVEPSPHPDGIDDLHSRASDGRPGGTTIGREQNHTGCAYCNDVSAIRPMDRNQVLRRQDRVVDDGDTVCWVGHGVDDPSITNKPGLR